MTAVRFWDVGAAAEASLPMTATDMQAHLVADWLPGLAPLAGAPLVSWPARLTLPYHHQPTNQDFLPMRRRAAWSDRQWNGFLSWMVGVCGTRQYLAHDGYQWVAPLSAFYANKRKRVDIDPAWPPPLPPGDLTASEDPTNPSRLMPDYMALRKGPGPDDWHLALVEAKGTSAALQNKAACPQNWHNQARNAIIEYRGTRVAPDRNLVTATRCSPGAVREFTTVLQLRAWNEDGEGYAAPTGVAVEAATVALLGICNSLGLRLNSRCLLHAQSLRRLGGEVFRVPPPLAEQHAEFKRAAIHEMKQLCDCDPADSEAGWTPAYLEIRGLEAPHDAQLLPHAVGLLRLLCLPEPLERIGDRFNELSRGLAHEMEVARTQFPSGSVAPPGLLLIPQEDDREVLEDDLWT